MFNRKFIREIVNELEDIKLRLVRVENNAITDEKITVCSQCGCIIRWDAIRGKSEIRTREVHETSQFQFIYLSQIQTKKTEEYIYTPYYCKKCVPADTKEV